MAQGTLKLFEEFALGMSDGTHDMNTHAFKVMLVSDALPAASLATPDSTDFTEVSGNGYTATGVALSTTYTEAGGVGTFANGAQVVTWTSTGTGDPSNIKTAIVYNTNAAAVNDAVAFIDMTVDGGTTAIDLNAGDITITFGANIYAATITP